MATEAQRRAVRKYDAENTQQIHLKLNKTTDSDILAYLERQDSIQGLIKRLIREEMEKHEAFENMAKRAQECERECSGMKIELVDGYKDEEAMRICMENDHRIYVGRHYPYEYRIDVDAKKLLCCYSIFNKSNI